MRFVLYLIDIHLLEHHESTVSEHIQFIMEGFAVHIVVNEDTGTVLLALYMYADILAPLSMTLVL